MSAPPAWCPPAPRRCRPERSAATTPCGARSPAAAPPMLQPPGQPRYADQMGQQQWRRWRAGSTQGEELHRRLPPEDQPQPAVLASALRRQSRPTPRRRRRRRCGAKAAGGTGHRAPPPPRAICPSALGSRLKRAEVVAAIRRGRCRTAAPHAQLTLRTTSAKGRRELRSRRQGASPSTAGADQHGRRGGEQRAQHGGAAGTVRFVDRARPRPGTVAHSSTQAGRPTGVRRSGRGRGDVEQGRPLGLKAVGRCGSKHTTSSCSAFSAVVTARLWAAPGLKADAVR